MKKSRQAHFLKIFSGLFILLLGSFLFVFFANNHQASSEAYAVSISRWPRPTFPWPRPTPTPTPTPTPPTPRPTPTPTPAPGGPCQAGQNWYSCQGCSTSACGQYNFWEVCSTNLDQQWACANEPKRNVSSMPEQKCSSSPPCGAGTMCEGPAICTSESTCGNYFKGIVDPTKNCVTPAGAVCCQRPSCEDSGGTCVFPLGAYVRCPAGKTKDITKGCPNMDQVCCD